MPGDRPKPKPGTPLKLREWQALQLLARGRGTKEVAYALGVSHSTAANIFISLRCRLGNARNAAHVVSIAHQRGLIVSQENLRADEEEKRLDMVGSLMPHSTVVVPTAGLVYHVQKLIEEVHGGTFRRETRVVIVSRRGDAEALRGYDRVFFDPACDGDLGSNVAMAEMHRAREAARERNRHLKLSTIAGGNVDDFVDTERRAHFRFPLDPASDSVEGYESDAERNARHRLHYAR